MKKIVFIVLLIILSKSLFSALIITRTEVDIISRELYHENIYAEIHNDLIISLWDFNKFELTLINHQLQIYTTIDFESFKIEMERQNQAQIDSELRKIDKERRELMANATMTLFSKMEPRFMIVDTLSIKGYKSYEYHVYNGDIIAQKIWISKSLQDRINQEVNPLNIKKVENIFKNNRSNYFKALGIGLDPVSSLVESIENVGYVVKRVDYGFREKADPEFEKEVESLVNVISDIKESKVDPAIFTRHQRYKQLDYNAYQIAVIKSMEKQIQN